MANGLDLMKHRIIKSEMLNDYNSFNNTTSLQQQRMILDKRKTLSRVVNYSYQGVFVKRQQDNEPIKALINPNKLKMDYDDKIISVGYEYNYKLGDIFEWIGTNTHWLIYLQDMTELAYFRGQIRRCSYEICWKDTEGEHSTYAALRGPTETKIDSIQKHEISIDNPNYSLNFLVPYNEENKKFFQRYTKFYLQNDDVCWRIEAVDRYSTPGIIEVNAVEYFANDHQDDIDNGLVGGLIENPKDPNQELLEIQGDTFIKPKTTHTYVYYGDLIDSWAWDKKLPIQATINEDNSISIKWTSSYSGQFILRYGNIEKTIIVESLF